MTSEYSTVKLPDGAILAYEIYGSVHLGKRIPIVLICGHSALRIDYERLTRSLSETRPVLIYDHRGMGDSRLANNNEILSIEMLARDLAFLLHTLRWKEISICGYSMGGVVAQQLLVLPHHPTHPIHLEFRTTSLFLVATRSVVQKEVGLGYKAPPPGTTRTLAEKKTFARRILASTFDPQWLAQHDTRFDVICQRIFNSFSDRPSHVIAKQGIALHNFDFAALLPKVSSETRVMIVHGNLDQIIPRYCGEDMHSRIRGAVFLQCGTQPGEVPSLDFGHHWYEYFDIGVWQNVMDAFIEDAPPSIH